MERRLKGLKIENYRGRATERPGERRFVYMSYRNPRVPRFDLKITQTVASHPKLDEVCMHFSKTGTFLTSGFALDRLAKALPSGYEAARNPTNPSWSPPRLAPDRLARLRFPAIPAPARGGQRVRRPAWLKPQPARSDLLDYAPNIDDERALVHQL